MPKTVPTPVSAALGLVPTVLDGVRRLPTKAVQLPVLALSSALTGMDLARREYDELSQRGERLVARLRGTSFDELEDKVEDSLAGTPLAKPYDAIEDAVEDVVEAVRTGGRKPRAATPERPSSDDTPVAEAEQPKGEPTPKATEPDSTRIDTAATADVVAAVEEVAAGVVVPSNLTAADLPLADYDHLTLGALRGRLRSLDVDQLVALRSYEKSKADRLPVVTMLDNRIAKLAAGESQPSGGSSAEPVAAPVATAAKPPKKVPGGTAAAKNDAPPHTKVRHT